MEARSWRSAVSRSGSIGARIMKLACGVMTYLLKDLGARRFVMRHGIHRVPQLRKRLIHPPPSAALISQGAMLGDAMPWIIRELFGKVHLLRRVELLPWQAKRGDRYPR